MTNTKIVNIRLLDEYKILNQTMIIHHDYLICNDEHVYMLTMILLAIIAITIYTIDLAVDMGLVRSIICPILMIVGTIMLLRLIKKDIVTLLIKSMSVWLLIINSLLYLISSEFLTITKQYKNSSNNNESLIFVHFMYFVIMLSFISIDSIVISQWYKISFLTISFMNNIRMIYSATFIEELVGEQLIPR